MSFNTNSFLANLDSNELLYLIDRISVYEKIILDLIFNCLLDYYYCGCINHKIHSLGFES
jgi:hypothetical protein